MNDATFGKSHSGKIWTTGHDGPDHVTGLGGHPARRTPRQPLVAHVGPIRDLLSGDGWNGGDREPASAALPLTLLLLTKAGANPSGDGFEVGLETLQEALCLLNTAVDREIVNRMLQRQDATPIGTGLIQGLQMLVQHAKEEAKSECHA